MAWYYDAHVHLSDPAYAPYIESVLAQMRHLKIKACCVSARASDSLRTLELSERDPNVLPFVGVHPEFACEDMAGIEEIVCNNGSAIAGIGEIGLDPSYTEGRRQERAFCDQMALAEKAGKPVSVHSRGSLDRIMEIAPSYDTGGVLVHWFDGSKRQLAQAMDLGFYVSYGPVSIYANDKQSLMSRTDKDRMLVETDGPVRFSRCFEGREGQVSFIPSVVFCAAAAMGETFDEASRMLERNSLKFLGLD